LDTSLYALLAESKLKSRMKWEYPQYIKNNDEQKITQNSQTDPFINILNAHRAQIFEF
jgi:hypothetical protein